MGIDWYWEDLSNQNGFCTARDLLSTTGLWLVGPVSGPALRVFRRIRLYAVADNGDEPVSTRVDRAIELPIPQQIRRMDACGNLCELFPDGVVPEYFVPTPRGFSPANTEQRDES